MKSHLTPSVTISELKKDYSRLQDGLKSRALLTVAHIDKRACPPGVGRRARIRTKEWRTSGPIKMTWSCPGDKLLWLMLRVDFLEEREEGPWCA